MINPNGDEFTKNDPTSGATNPGEAHISASGAPRFESTASTEQPTSSATTADKWQQSLDKATIARDKATFYMRENPVPTILGALAVGLAIGLAIRYTSERDEPVVETKTLGNVDLSFLTMPFLWPFFKTVKNRYEEGAEVVKDRMGEGVDRLKKVDVDDYVKPLRKQWRSWTR